MLQVRPRRLRASEAMRRLVRETELSVNDFIYPLFVVHGKGVRQEIPSMPGQFRLSVDELCKEAAEVRDLGIPGILLFGLPKSKDEIGSEAYAPDGIVQQAVKALKSAVSDLLVITDVCLCEYTSHGHCGIVRDGQVLNDQTLQLLAKTAVSHAQVGAEQYLGRLVQRHDRDHHEQRAQPSAGRARHQPRINGTSSPNTTNCSARMATIGLMSIGPSMGMNERKIRR